MNVMCMLSAYNWLQHRFSEINIFILFLPCMTKVISEYFCIKEVACTLKLPLLKPLF